MRSPRFVLFFIIIITFISVVIDLPRIGNFDPQRILRPFIGPNDLSYRLGLDLEGGTSITFKADMKDIAQDKRDGAIDAAKIIIERRINLFGVSEPVIQTAKSQDDYRIIVELPGITDLSSAIGLIGTTAKLEFWEEEASESGKTASPSAYPLGILEVLGPNARETDLGGADLQESSVTFDPNTGKPQVQLIFTQEGGSKFAQISTRNVGKLVAIVLDNQIIEAAEVQTPILDGNAVISGNFTSDSANRLSIQLNAGALPVPLSVLEQHVVGPTLGKISLAQSLFAGILGFIVIVIFMIVLYKGLGIIASLALVIYVLITLAIFKLSSLTPYGITLTLSGIAGFVLSVGMAVDANILIFERMKEEKRLGKRSEVVLELGFLRAWTSIRDSNIATLITCFILYQFGTGIVRGFALVLAIGVLISMFSAIVVTRTLLRLVYK
ncbi:MAG: Protein-export membrane protein SecD [uncultured bacterium]|nr:MAG: Protein-export membrane protein SecD [uncultured bacterium]OGH13110.1 MAG: protein-export membrane protein SecD [Candidatus Levybacteria bacterium RIFCSPHIGHO2_01_FULL_38_26]